VKRAGGTVLMNLLNSGHRLVRKTYQVHIDEMKQGNVIDAQNTIPREQRRQDAAAFTFTPARRLGRRARARDAGERVVAFGSASASMKFSSNKRYTAPWSR